MNDLEAKRHIGAGIAIRNRENINPVDIFTTLKKVPNTSGQTPHHAGRINVSNSLCQDLKPGKIEPAKSLACREICLGEKNRVLAGLARRQTSMIIKTLTGPYGTFGMEPASLQYAT
jgi:hypothetical protein